MAIGIGRRQFISVLGAAVAWPVAARAQQPDRMRRVVVLMSSLADDPETLARVKAFEQGLQKAGLAKGRNLLIDYHFGVNTLEQDRSVVAEVVGLGPDVVLAHTPSTIAALQQATHTIPIVFVQAADPVNLGLVTSLAKPENNVTGFVLLEPSLGGKWLQWLHDAVPNVTRVLVLQNSNNPSSPGFTRAIEAVAPSFGITLSTTSVGNGSDIERSVAAFADRPNSGLLILPGPVFTAERKRIIALASSYRLPAIYPFRYYATDGGLIYYGSDNVDQWRQAASYVDRILRGTLPRDLPIQLPTKYELVINLKTANALGLTIPRDVLLVADEVIE